MADAEYKRLKVGALSFNFTRDKQCTVDGCARAHAARGYCQMHWSRWKKHGDPLVCLKAEELPDLCEVAGCDRESRSRWKGGTVMCAFHYLRMKTLGSVDDPRPAPPSNGLCVAPGCSVHPRSNGAQYCERHYYQIRRTGSLLTKVVKGMKVVAEVVRFSECQYCGKPTTGNKHCSSRCSTRASRGNPLEKSCRNCGAKFTPVGVKAYCTDECRRIRELEVARLKRHETVSPPVRELQCVGCGCEMLHHRRSGSPKKYCEECALEMATRPTPPHNFSCAVCESAFLAKDKRTMYCSKRCSRLARKCANPDAVRAEYLRSKSLERARLAPSPLRLLKASRNELVWALKRMIAAKKAADKAERCCAVCGDSLGLRRKKYCSAKCYNKSEVTQAVRRRSAAAHRGAKRGAHSERIDPLVVFEAAGWRCQICSRKTPASLRGTVKKQAPELDHVVPLSKGGTHTWGNVQCACRECNRWKSNKIVAGQMGLFTVTM